MLHGVRGKAAHHIAHLFCNSWHALMLRELRLSHSPAVRLSPVARCWKALAAVGPAEALPKAAAMTLSMTWASVSCSWASMLARQQSLKPCEQLRNNGCIPRLVSDPPGTALHHTAQILCMLSHQTTMLDIHILVGEIRKHKPEDCIRWALLASIQYLGVAQV